ncbi:MAG TPA: type IVB secretion system protein IcmH/DotU [Blastocatellia bacterium]|nr:type IVB secretion system protein IcmH/DotU [Blastocatellia bacterium]
MPQQVAVNQPKGRANGKPANELINLATPMFQMMMRIRARMMAPSDEMRRTLERLIKELEEKGAKRGYKERQLQDAKFALTALIDETVLAGGGAMREQWERYPLQLEYFKEALAGNKFFERLDGLMKEGASEVDVVEVYYLCLLLGFKGKYDVFLEDQLPAMTNGVAEYLRKAGRLRVRTLSPHALLNDQPAPPPPEPEFPRWIKLALVAAVGVVSGAYLLLNWSLLSTLDTAMRESLLK